MANGTKRRGRRLPPLRRPRRVVRPVLVRAFRHALEKSDASHAAAARWLQIGTSTLGRWLRGESPIDVETIMMSRRLWRPFFVCLLDIERKAGEL